MYNKKALSKATAELDKAKAPAKPKDIITDPMGQWKYPGLPTRIPGNDITMKGVGYPVVGVTDTGQRQIMLPGADYTFPGADYVDEYPQMKKGGSKKKTKSISGTNKLLKVHPLFKNYKHREFDPKAKHFQDGGDVEADLTQDEIDQYVKGGFIVEDISVPELNQAKKGKSVNTSKSPKPSVYTAKNDKDYAFRKKAYDDSLSMYNLSTLNNMLANNYEKDPNVSEKEQMDYAKKNDTYIQKMKKIKSQALTKFGDVYGKQTKPAQTIIKPYKPEVEPIDFKSGNKKSVEKTKKIPNIETRNSVNSYEDSLTAYNNYVQRKDILANLKKDQFKSKKELDEFLNKENLKYPTNPSLAAKTKSIKKQFVYPKGESIISLEDYIKPKGSQTSKPKDVIVDKPNNTAKSVKVNNAQYPQGYQPYSLYGKVLDPEVYGYAESLNGKPVQVSQFADTYGHKAKMDTYRKSGQYPWKKQKGGMVAKLTPKEIQEYINQGYIVEEH